MFPIDIMFIINTAKKATIGKTANIIKFEI